MLLFQFTILNSSAEALGVDIVCSLGIRPANLRLRAEEANHNTEALRSDVGNYTLTYQNLQKSRVPINSILGFIIRIYKKVGFGRLRYIRLL